MMINAHNVNVLMLISSDAPVDLWDAIDVVRFVSNVDESNAVYVLGHQV